MPASTFACSVTDPPAPNASAQVVFHGSTGEQRYELTGAAADLGADVVQIVGTDTAPLHSGNSMQVVTDSVLYPLGGDQLHPGDLVYARVAALISPTVQTLLAS